MIKHKLNLDEIGRARLGEAKAELELAERFLNDGLIRNAAGKAFQAWKSYLSHQAIKNRDLFNYEGYRRISGNAVVPRNEWILAIVPTNLMMEIATKLGTRDEEVIELTALALTLHEYQYNGPDPSGVLSKVPSDEDARKLVRRLIDRLRDKLKRED